MKKCWAEVGRFPEARHRSTTKFDHQLMLFKATCSFTTEHYGNKDPPFVTVTYEILLFTFREDQRGWLSVNWWTWIKFSKNRKIRISLPLLSQLFLKYAYMVDVLIHQFTHMEFSNSTFPILLNFWKTIWLQKTWIKSNQVHWQNHFSKA